MENLILLDLMLAERDLLKAYRRLKKEIPNLKHVTFEVSEWRKDKVYGFYHIGNECEIYEHIEDLARLASSRKEARSENEILFRKFN